MAREQNRGEIWTFDFRAPDKRRSVVVLARQVVIGFRSEDKLWSSTCAIQLTVLALDAMV